MYTLENMKSLVSDILARHAYMGEEELQAKYKELGEIVLSREIMELPYEVRNEPFLTASKIKAFERCEFCYHKKYVELAPDRTMTEKDYFIIGQGVDDFLTLGADYFNAHYAVMDSRITDIDAAMMEQEEKIAQAQGDVKKDGTRSLTGLKAEAKAEERLAFLKTLHGKTQITNTMFETIMQAVNEFNLCDLFDKEPKKTVFFHVVSGFLLKVELDDYKPDTHVINDTKTTSSIISACDHDFPEMYSSQAAIYEWVVEENTLRTPTVRLQVIDKNPCFSRSLGWEYTKETLRPVRGRLIDSIARMRVAHDTQYFSEPPDQRLKFQCAYYGIEGHGRPSEFLKY